MLTNKRTKIWTTNAGMETIVQLDFFEKKN